ncbi:hypothetical protein A0H81_06269 [Grifola frondosa]|uniref:SWI5-dependent HO expression protein 3 n=1 Tax=Grifola frondosa TaxID=5627 RepID=A0A1C7MCJ4_GRIFR|nr:hypothetical protein A0H81_06269 [Grifola frondosa]
MLVTLDGAPVALPKIQPSPATEAVAHQNLLPRIQHTHAELFPLTALENTILRGPRPLPPGILGSPPDFDSPSVSGQSNHMLKMGKRNSYEALQGLAGPDSNLPLPRRDERRLSFGEENGIREGIPTGSSGRRTASPTRTLSRIPISSVGNARALAEDDGSNGAQHGTGLSASTSSMSTTTSPNRRASFAPGNTTRVLADLQTGVMNAKNALENTKAQLRVSQRQVSQLTRQTEDLKEVRERLRLENEGLNNVVARKERLLQEVLDRARKAEAEVLSLRAQLKSESTNSKKSMRDMETSLTESNARSQKAEREYAVLRDSVKGLVQSFQADTDGVREEMRKREDKLKKEAEEMSRKYKMLVEEVRKEREEGGAGLGDVRALQAEHVRVTQEIEEGFREEMRQLREDVDRASKESDEAGQTAKWTISHPCLPHLVLICFAGL